MAYVSKKHQMSHDESKYERKYKQHNDGMHKYRDTLNGYYQKQTKQQNY